jgi:hypothetical protein
MVTRIFGVRVVPDLGTLTTSLGRVSDTPIVERSWGLLGGADFYGPNFTFSEFLRTRNYLTAVITHFTLMFGALMIAIPFVRKVVRRYVYKPGDGPTKGETKNDRVEYRGVGIPDVKTPHPPRAFCKARYEGSLYDCGCSLLETLRNAKSGSYRPLVVTSGYLDLAGWSQTFRGGLYSCLLGREIH